jgi:hypothetical protein
MNCDFFRHAPEHDISLLDCGPDAGSPGSFRKAWAEVNRRIRARQFDLAVVTDRKHCFWRPGGGLVSGAVRWGKAFLREPRRLAHGLVPRELSRAGIPWALLERNDQCLIREGNHSLFQGATRVFVRELLQNRYEIFKAYREGADHLRLWPSCLPGGPRVPMDLGKILPISLGLRPGPDFGPVPSAEKIHDLVWAGSTAFRSPRMAAVDEMQESSRKLGWRFLDQEFSSREEYWRACSRAWLCLSPSGNGWDCFRHYEILAAGSVPLMNTPWIERYAPLQHGRHGLFYSVERGHLTEVVQSALRDKEGLARIAAAGREHVRKYHSYEALRNYVIHETLRAGAPGGFSNRPASDKLQP